MVFKKKNCFVLFFHVIIKIKLKQYDIIINNTEIQHKIQHKAQQSHLSIDMGEVGREPANPKK